MSEFKMWCRRPDIADQLLDKCDRHTNVRTVDIKDGGKIEKVRIIRLSRIGNTLHLPKEFYDE